MNIQFYATKADFIDILRFASDNLQGRFLEDYSAVGRDLEWLDTHEALIAYLDAAEHRSQSIMFCIEDACHLVGKKRIDLDPSAGGAFRYTATGQGLFQFHYVDIERSYRWPSDPENYQFFCEWPFQESRVAVNTYKRAKKWADSAADHALVDAWPWLEIERAAGKIERYLRKSFVGRAQFGGGMLPGAAGVIAEGPVWEGAA